MMKQNLLDKLGPGADCAPKKELFAPIALVTVCAALGFVTLRFASIAAWQGPLMVAASTGYLMMALVAGGHCYRYGQFIVGALFFCWLGDIVGPSNFLLGAGAFLIAHLMFVPAFASLGLNWRAVAIGVPFQVAASVWSLVTILPRIPAGEQLFIVTYTVVISMMVLAAIGTLRHSPIVGLAGVVFYVSDIFVGRWRYLEEAWGGLICYPLYYTACILFAWSVYQLHTQGEARVATPPQPEAG